MRKLIGSLFIVLMSVSLCFAGQGMGPGPGCKAYAASSAMKQKLIGGEYGSLSAAAARYLSVAGGYINSSEGLATSLVSVSGTIRNLQVRLSGAPENGAGTQKYTVTVRKASGANAMANTTLTCEVSEAETSCSDAANSFTVAADDKLSILVTPSGTPIARAISTRIEFQGDAANQAILTTAGNSTTTTDAATRYLPVHGGVTGNSLDSVASQVFPVAGTITGFYVRQSAAPGAGVSRVWKIRINGSDQAASALTFDAADVAKNVTGLSLAVNAGDRLSISYANTGTQAASNAFVGILFAPTTNGQFPILTSYHTTSFPQGSTRYLPLSTTGLDIQASETYFMAGYNDFTIKAMYAYTSVAPGGTETFTFTLRKQTGPDDVSATYNCTITGAAQSCSRSEDLTPAQNEGYDTKIVSSASVGLSGKVSIGYMGYIAP
jgi:hypothetical protein